MSRVLVTGTRAPAALDLARKLSRAGHEVHGADSSAARLCLSSAAVASSHRLPCPRTRRKDHLEAIADLVRRLRIDLIVPTCEEVFLLAAARDRLGAPLLAPDFALLRELHHKTRFQTLVRAAGLPAVETHAGRDFVNHAAAASGSPWITKPAFSRFGGHLARHADAESARRFLDEHRTCEWTVQALLEGGARCTYGIARGGRLLAHCTYRPVLALRDGASTVFESVDDTAIRAWCETFIARHRIDGQIAFDFIVRDGVPLAIECNPRATSGAHFFGPEIHRALTAAEPVPDPPAGLRRGLFFLALFGSPALALKTRDVTFDSADPLPFLTQALPFAVHLCHALRHSCSLTDATVRDIRWDGEDLP